jgi:hypothetical protein
MGDPLKTAHKNKSENTSDILDEGQSEEEFY